MSMGYEMRDTEYKYDSCYGSITSATRMRTIPRKIENER